NLQSQRLGFDHERLLLFWTRHGQTGLGRGPALMDLYRRAQERIASLPGVRSASFSGISMFGRTPLGSRLAVEGHTGEAPGGLWNYVEPGFLEFMGIPLVSGRYFTDQDNTPTSPRVAIINETMARYYFGNTNPIGRRFGFRREAPQFEIVGVMKDSTLQSLRDEHRLEFYIPYREGANIGGIVWLAARISGDLADLPARIRNELLNVDPDLAVFKIGTMENEFDRAMGQERIIATLSGFFSVLAALLTCIGLFGVMSFTAARRTNEIGIRLTLGATRSGVMGMVLKESVLLVVAGVAIGVPTTLAATRLISSRLFGVGSADPLTIAAATLLMIAVAALAGFLPARRASRVDPMVALRYE
ncbi:MAG: ABC transporter permease, partial [Phycisphaerales bacterium]|nr:ABC transporter permease [Phycisphaerales bacterium]